MAKLKKKKNMMNKLQQIQTKRGAYERKRHKKYLWFKNRGLLDYYFNRFEKKVEKPIVITHKIKWWRKIIMSIQRLFYNLKIKYA